MTTKLSAVQELRAKAWIHDTLILSGIKDKASSKRYGPAVSISNNPDTVSAAKAIWNCVLNRTLANTNSAFDKLASYRFNSRLDHTGRMYTETPVALATYVAWFCAINKIYWDNSILTPFEMAEFTKSYLGQALKDYDCFTVSLAPAAPTVSSTPKTTVGGIKHSGGSVTKVSPSGNVGELSASTAYSGHLSPFVRDLLSTSGTKEHPASSVMFRIEGNNSRAARVIPTAFIRPLTVSGKTGTTNKVFMGSANGRTDCTVYFDDLTAANDFLTKCNSAGKIPAIITSVHVTKKIKDRNGYYKVNTEFGPVFISAKKLQEALKEATKNEPVKEDTNSNDFDSFAFTDKLMSEI